MDLPNQPPDDTTAAQSRGRSGVSADSGDQQKGRLEAAQIAKSEVLPIDRFIAP
jgi:hypothetical protein